MQIYSSTSTAVLYYFSSCFILL